MSRKALLFIVFMLCVLSIMTIGIWGASPDPSDNITVSSIYFSDERIVTNDNGNKIIFVEEIITDFETNYDIEIAFRFLPDNASHLLMIYSNEDSVSAVIKENNVYVAFSQKTTVSITITDRKSEKSDTVTLVFRAPGEVDVPEDIFND